jgi:hypothetical protein
MMKKEEKKEEKRKSIGYFDSIKLFTPNGNFTVEISANTKLNKYIYFLGRAKGWGRVEECVSECALYLK